VGARTHAIEAGDANDFYSAVESKRVLDDHTRNALLQKLDLAFQKL
jgi:hypothetical protein